VSQRELDEEARAIDRPQQYVTVYWLRYVLLGMVEEALPEPTREELAFYPIRQAIEQVHFPDSEATAEEARRRFVVNSAATRLRNAETSACSGHAALPLPLTGKIRDRILGRMPFELTEYQQASLFREDSGIWIVRFR
jgi:RecG-like helicase